MQFLALIEAIASNLNAQNIEQFISLTENLITVGESIFKHQGPASTTPTDTTAQ